MKCRCRSVAGLLSRSVCSAVGVADRDMLASTVCVASAIILSAQKRVVAVGDEVKNEARETTLHC